MKIGYARVSTKQQNLDRQLAALEEAGCDKIFMEKVSGRNIKQRPELKKALAALEVGNMFIVAEWERATRSFEDGIKIMAEIGKKEADLKVLDRPYIDTTTPLGKAFLGFLSAISQDEIDRKIKQCDDGREKALKRGVKLGRKSKLNVRQERKVLEMIENGYSRKEIAEIFNVGTSTIQRISDKSKM